MRIRLLQMGHQTCLPLPPAAGRAKGFAAGDEVEVVFDPDRGQMLVRPAPPRGTAPVEVEATVARALEAFLEEHADAMRELVAL